MNDNYDNAETDAVMFQRHVEKATPKQLSYFHGLSQERIVTGMIKGMPPDWFILFNNLLQDLATNDVQVVYNQKRYAKADVSKFIDALLKCPAKGNGEPNSKYQPGADVLEDGMYRHPNGTIYKVYHTVHGANVQVAKRLVVTEAYDDPYVAQEMSGTGYPLKKTATVEFKYEGKAPLKLLRPNMRLTLEQAREFGALYGTCCICGRTLTNELSISLGIGPVCGKREFGGEFTFMVDAMELKLAGKL